MEIVIFVIGIITGILLTAITGKVIERAVYKALKKKEAEEEKEEIDTDDYLNNPDWWKKQKED